MEIYENSNFLICYDTIDEIERNFLNSIINYIIYYPIDWYNFLENILKNNLIVSFNNNAMIVSLEILTPQLKNSFNNIYNCMRSSGVILDTIKTKGFLIIYVYSKIISDFFKNSGFWLEYLTAYCTYELGLNTFRGGLIKTSDGKIQEVDVVLEYQSNIFFIECKDTYTYSNKDLRKLYNLRRKINGNSYGIFVCSKLAYDIDYEKYEIDLLKYKFDYFMFREELKELIANKFTSLK